MKKLGKVLLGIMILLSVSMTVSAKPASAKKIYFSIYYEENYLFNKYKIKTSLVRGNKTINLYKMKYGTEENFTINLKKGKYKFVAVQTNKKKNKSTQTIKLTKKDHFVSIDLKATWLGLSVTRCRVGETYFDVVG